MSSRLHLSTGLALIATIALGNWAMAQQKPAPTGKEQPAVDAAPAEETPAEAAAPEEGAAADPEDAHDVGMIQLRGELRFFAEPVRYGWVGGQERMQHFEGDLSLETQVPNSIHAAKPALSQFLHELVLIAERAPKLLLPRVSIFP